MLSGIKCWCLFLAALLFMDGKAAAGAVDSASPIHFMVALIAGTFREHQNLVGMIEKMPLPVETGCVLEVSGQGLPDAVAKADQAGVSCTFNVLGNITLDAPLDLKGHRLIGQPSWEFPHDLPRLLPARKYGQASVTMEGFDKAEQVLILPELDHSLSSYQSTKPLITPSADFSGDVLVRLWPDSAMEKLTIDERRVLGVAQMNPSEQVRVALADIDWVVGGLSQFKAVGKQCGRGSGRGSGGGQGGCAGKPSGKKACSSTYQRGSEVDESQSFGGGAAGGGGGKKPTGGFSSNTPADAQKGKEEKKGNSGGQKISKEDIGGPVPISKEDTQKSNPGMRQSGDKAIDESNAESNLPDEEEKVHKKPNALGSVTQQQSDPDFDHYRYLEFDKSSSRGVLAKVVRGELTREGGPPASSNRALSEDLPVTAQTMEVDSNRSDDAGHNLSNSNVNPSEYGEMTLTGMDVPGGFSPLKAAGKQCGGGGGGGGQGGCAGKPSGKKARSSTYQRGSEVDESSLFGGGAAGGGEPPRDSRKKEEPADADESLKKGKTKKEKNKKIVNIGSPVLDGDDKSLNILKSNDIPEVDLDLDNDRQNFNPDLGGSGMDLSMGFEFGDVSETGAFNIANEEPGDNLGQRERIPESVNVAGDPIPESVNDDDDDIIFSGESNNADDDFSGSIDEDQRALPPPPPPCGKETGTEERERSPSPECVDV